jgi:hypothetical protein
VNRGEDTRLDHARDIGRKIEGRRFGKRCGGSRAQRCAVDQALQEGSRSGRQEPYRHFISGRVISASSAALERSGVIGPSTRFIAKIAKAG